MRLSAAGDAAIVAALEPRIDPGVNRRVLAIAEDVRRARPAGVTDVVPAYATLTVYFDPLATDVASLESRIRRAAEAPAAAEPRREAIVIPVRYGGEDGRCLSAR
jgi:allophanate hydrolase subunit 1